MDYLMYTDYLYRAIGLAQKAHGDQKYGDNEPYFSHLHDVFLTLKGFGVHYEMEFGAELLVGAYLHDIVEDTTTTLKYIQSEFNRDIAWLVDAVTNEPGKNRKEKFLKTAPKILNHPYAIVLKLADRIANTEYSLKNKSKQLQMYVKEYPFFKKSLTSDYNNYYSGYKDIINEIWELLDNLYEAARANSSN